MTLRKSLALAAPLMLTLALAGCGDGADDAAGGLDGEPVADVATPSGSSWTQTVTRTEEGGWLVGNPDAPIKLLEYGSLTCPACAQFSAEGSQQLLDDYVDSGRVNYEFRSFMIHGVPDLVLTRMLECGLETAAVPLADQIWGKLANEQAYVFDTSNQAALEQANKLPTDQRLVALADVSGTLDWFAARGISRSQGEACLSDTDAVQKLADLTQKSAQDRNIDHTPTFFVNGQEIEPTGWQGVEAALQQAGARKE